MNTYFKFEPNVFLAKCPEPHQKGDIIPVTTKYGKENDSIVFNLIFERDGFYYYSIVRADGFNVQEWAKRKAERLEGAQANASAKSDQYWEAASEGKDFLVLAEPIKVGHHSEKRHRALIDRNHARMAKSMDLQKKAEAYEARASYWASHTDEINLSMPESLEYFAFKLEGARATHEGLKNGTIECSHSFSLTYAKKEVNDLVKKVELAGRLWGNNDQTNEE